MSAFIKRARFWCLAIAIGLIVVPIRASAQSNFPTRTIRIVVPIPPGPVADALPRMVAERLAQRWGQPVIVENRPGGALNIGAEAVARAQPDGHTLLATPPGPLVISQHFYPKLGFDPTAFVPISILASLPFVLIASPTSPASTLTELVAYAKANPNKVTYASSGVGSAPHLAAEMLAIAAGIRMVHIPYKGTAPAMIDLRAGHVDLMIDNLSNALAQFMDGKVKILGVGSEQRLARAAERTRDFGNPSRLHRRHLVCGRSSAKNAAGHCCEALVGDRRGASFAGYGQETRRSSSQAGCGIAGRDCSLPQARERSLA